MFHQKSANNTKGNIMLNFRSVEELDRDLYRKTLKDTGFDTRSCEYSYANLFAWRSIYETSFATLCDGFAIRLKYKGEHHYFAPVVSVDNAVKAYGEIIEHAKADGEGAVKFVCLPERFANILKDNFENAVIEIDRDKFDYIYEVAKLSEFSGKSLHAKRNHKNKFFSLYKEVYRFKSITADDIGECLEFNKKWYELNAEFSLDDERTATEQLLINFEKIGLVGAMIYVNGELCAYTLASSTFDGSDTLTVHTEKGLYDYQGVYPTICSEFLRHHAIDYTYVNREDDAGDEGLRKSKLSYKPVFFEEKYGGEIHF